MSVDSINGSYVNSWSTPYGRSTAKPEEDDKDKDTVGTDKPDADKDTNTGIDNKPTPEWGGSILGDNFGNISLDGVNVGNGGTDPYEPPENHLANLSDIVGRTMAALGLEGQPVRFNELLQHRDDLTEIFSAKVKTGLRAAGVSDDADFRLTQEADGSLKVHSSHKDKAKIEKFFKENPELATDYEMIDSLNQLENTRKNNKVSMNDAYSQTRLLSMTSGLMSGGGAAASASVGTGSSTAAIGAMAMGGGNEQASFVRGGFSALV